MENEQEVEKMKGLSNKNPAQYLKKVVEMKDFLTAYDHESKQPEIAEIKDPGSTSGSKDAHSDDRTNDDYDVTHREYEHKSLFEIETKIEEHKDKMRMSKSEQRGMMLQSEGQGGSWICEELKMTMKEILSDDELKMAMKMKKEILSDDDLKMITKKKKEMLTDNELKMVMKKKEILSDDDLKMIMKKKKEMLIDDKSKIERSYDDYELVTAEMHMNPMLYLAAINGDLAHFKTILDRNSMTYSIDDILSRLTVTGNTFLHVAAKHGNKDIVEFLVSMKPSFVLAKNFDGETVLHIAIKREDEPMVKTLLGTLSGNEREKHDLLMAENEIGNTALHQALLGGCKSIANILIEQDSVPLYHLNSRLESAIYLAVKAGYGECASSILKRCSDLSRLNQIFENKSPIREQYFKKENKSPIHAAIKMKDTVILKAITDWEPDLIRLRDSKGRNPLHFAASLGHMGAVRCLLVTHESNATRRDRRGELPIHLAARKGHIDIIKLLLEDFQDVDELLSMSGCNILHIAAWKGRHNVVSFVLKHPKLGSLLNMKDIFGNTALHMACMKNHPMIVSDLTWDKRVDTKAVNNKGMTALDVAYQCDLRNPTLAKCLIWAALKSASVPEHLGSGRKLYADEKVYKKRATTLLVVATLVATVTFAAGFTMPGGYINSETSNDLGMAAMWKDAVFHLFVFCDTIAIYSSIFAVTALMWAQIGDINLVINALELAAPLLGVALIMMSVAFVAGVTIVVTKLRWLQIALLAMGVSFSAAMLVFLLPLCLLLPVCLLLSSRIQILRYISYYPFCFLALVSRKRPHMHH